MLLWCRERHPPSCSNNKKHAAHAHASLMRQQRQGVQSNAKVKRRGKKHSPQAIQSGVVLATRFPSFLVIRALERSIASVSVAPKEAPQSPKHAKTTQKRPTYTQAYTQSTNPPSSRPQTRSTNLKPSPHPFKTPPSKSKSHSYFTLAST